MPHIAVVQVQLAADPSEPWRVRPLSHAPAKTTQILKGHTPADTEVDCWDGVRLKPGDRAAILAFFDDALEAKYTIALDDSESCTEDDGITTDFRVLHDRRGILQVVSARLARMRREGRSQPRRALFVPIPEGTSASEINMLNINCLAVPADPEYRPILLRKTRSPDWRVRADAAGYLAEYPGPGTVTALRRLMNDPMQDTVAAPRRYPVRESAYIALRKLGAQATAPDGFRAGASFFVTNPWIGVSSAFTNKRILDP
jgi:hypothetical protein